MPLRNNKTLLAMSLSFWERIPHIPYLLARKEHLGNSLHTSGSRGGRKSSKGYDSGVCSTHTPFRKEVF